MKIIFYDTEITPTQWMMYFKEKDCDEFTKITKKFQLQIYLEEHKNDLFVGYNNHHFDDCLIRLILSNINPYDLWEEMKKNPNLVFWKVWPKAEKLPITTFDVMEDNISLGLKEAELNMGYSVFESEDDFMNDEYCKYDVKMTEKVFNAREKKEQFYTTKMYIKDYFNVPWNLMSKTTAQVIGTSLATTKVSQDGILNWNTPKFFKFQTQEYKNIQAQMEARTLTAELDNKKDIKTMIHGVETLLGSGGCHASVNNKTFKSNEEYVILDLDYTSFYPFIMANPINEELRYHSRAIPYYQKIYDIVNDRVVAKKAGDKVKADALKLIINKIFGMSGDKWNPIYDWSKCREVCIMGQLLILNTIEMIEVAGIEFELIQINTDGFTIYVKRSEVERILWLSKTNPSTYGMNLEASEYSLMSIKDVNNYFAIKGKEIVKYKGAWCKVNYDYKRCNHPIVMKAFVNNIAFNKPILDTINECEDMMMFATTCSRKGVNYTATYYGDEEIKGKNHRVFVVNDPNAKSIGKLKNGTINKFPDIGENHKIVDSDMNDLICDIDKSELDLIWYGEKALRFVKAWQSTKKVKIE